MSGVSTMLVFVLCFFWLASGVRQELTLGYLRRSTNTLASVDRRGAHTGGESVDPLPKLRVASSQACPRGTFNNVHNAYCEDCPINEYSDEKNSAKCKECPFPKATFQSGSQSCDAYSLNQGEALVISSYCIIGVIVLASSYLAKKDRLATIIFTVGPSADFISDVLYVTQVKFYRYIKPLSALFASKLTPCFSPVSVYS